MISDEQAFWNAIDAAPTERDRRETELVFADWLDEHDDLRGPWLRDDELCDFVHRDAPNPLVRYLRLVAHADALAQPFDAIGRNSHRAVQGALPLFRELFGCVDSSRRWATLSILIAVGAPAVLLPELRELWVHSDADCRVLAIEAFAQADAAEANHVATVVAALDDAQAVLRIAALRGLRYYGERAAPAVLRLRQLLRRATTDDERAEVARTLAAIGPAAVAERLLALTKGALPC